MVAWLQLQDISKSYDGHKVLDSVGLSIERGEIFTLLGPSGAGKSTLLNAIAGLVPLDKGSVLLRGTDITTLPPQERNIAMVFQDFSLFSNMSVRENIAFPLIARRVKGLGSLIKWRFDLSNRRAVYREVDRVLELTRIQKHSNKRPNQLSGGEQQRVAIARALVFDPDLLCLDEPFSALDRNLRQDLQNEIRELQQELKKTILYVTHDQTEALTVSSRLGILHDGRIDQVGTPKEVYERPSSAFSARFLGDCNVLQYAGYDTVAGRSAVRTAKGACFCVSEMPKQESGLLCIRPEKLRIENSDFRRDRPTVNGVVANVLFFGSQTKLLISLDSGDTLQVLLTNTPSEPLSEGSSVTISYDPESVVVLSGAT